MKNLNTPQNVLLVYVSLFSARIVNGQTVPPTKMTYQIGGGKGTVQGTQTNEAVLAYLARNKDTKPDKIIAICSDSVRHTPCAVEGYKSTRDYLENGVLPTLGYGPDVLQVVKAPDQMNDEKRNEIIRKVSEGLAPQDRLYIDLSGGMRDTAMLLVTIARYLQTILNVNTRQVYYAEMGNVKIGKPNMLRNSTQLYDILEMISAVDLFFETGNITKLRSYLKCQNTSVQAQVLLEKIEAFSNDLALCQMSNIKGDLQKISKALKDKDSTLEENTLYQLLFSLFSKRFSEDFRGLSSNSTESLPHLIAWCAERQLYQQALTLISEELPAFVCKHIFLQPTEQGYAYLAAQGQNRNKAWPYPVFHAHFRNLVLFKLKENGKLDYHANLCVNQAQVHAGERPLYRYPTKEMFSSYLDTIVQENQVVFDTAQKEMLGQVNELYQQTLLYRNYINHASKLPELLLSAGVLQLNMENIRNLLCDTVDCVLAIQRLKKCVPEGVEAISLTQKL